LISYCVACYRPVYARQLIDDLIDKTAVAFEILLWMNITDADFDEFLKQRIAGGAPIRIIGRTPENIGMSAYPRLFAESSFDMIVQIDDDVVCISRNIASVARRAFDRFPNVWMLTADVWQDEYTTGARPPMNQYRTVDRRYGLHEGPIDGWFSVYRRAAVALCAGIDPGRYGYLGSAICARLRAHRRRGLLCTGMKVFHVTGPYYASYFGSFESEIAKYRLVGREDMVAYYEAERDRIPPHEELAGRVERIREHLGSY
jgi:hypothetical protein